METLLLCLVRMCLIVKIGLTAPMVKALSENSERAYFATFRPNKIVGSVGGRYKILANKTLHITKVMDW